MSNRRLPIKRSPEHNLIINAVDDFFGEGCSQEDQKLKKDICLWVMGRKRGVELIEEQQEILWYIKGNLADQTYRQNLLKTP